MPRRWLLHFSKVSNTPLSIFKLNILQFLVLGITCIQPETWANMILSSVDTNYNGRVNTTCEEGFVFNMTGVLLSERPSYWESTCSGSGKWDPPLLACIGEKNAEMIMTQIIPDIFSPTFGSVKNFAKFEDWAIEYYCYFYDSQL